MRTFLSITMMGVLCILFSGCAVERRSPAPPATRPPATQADLPLSTPASSSAAPAQERVQTTAALMKDARRYIAQNRYTQALATLDQILTIDPTNEYALSVRPLVEERALASERKQYAEQFSRQYTRQLPALEEKRIPYGDIYRFTETEVGGDAGGGRIPGGGPLPPSMAGEELWVVARPAADAQQPDDRPGSGQLAARHIKDGKEELIPVPLKHTDVKASIAGYISSTTVKQQFHNPFAEKIEAVYVFPLPESAAINEFVMTIGDRRIRGIIREREEAKRIYEEAKAQGYVASLLTQERPNVFTQSVANIEPGKQIDVDITYYHALRYADGWYEWVFPMVVGPRYNPAGKTDGVGAVPRGAAGSTGQQTEVQYLKPTERSGHDIDLSLEINAPVSLEEIACTSHKIEISRPNPKRAAVSIAAADTLPNKDFVLRYRVAGETIKSGMIIHRDQKGGYFSLMVYPPMQLRQQDRLPAEMVFLVDVSGSMSGAPLDQSKAAMRYALQHMDERDTFQVITFSGSNRILFDRPQPVSADATTKAMRFIEDTSAGGGTEMLPAIRKALTSEPDPQRRRIVTFLTDGFVGNENDILLATHESLGTTRIFAFGVGSSPNRYLMDGLARVGRGSVAYLGLRDSGEEVMKQYFDRIACPAMADIKVDFGPGMQTRDLYPTRKSDLFVGRPVILTGRFSGELPETVQVHGQVSGKDVVIRVPVDRENQSNPALAAIWARQRISDLSDQMFYEPQRVSEFASDIKQTALEFGLMSQYTAFTAVDSSGRTAGDHGTTVAVPVPMPEGVKYETTVPERAN